MATGDTQLGLYLPRLLRHGTAYVNYKGETHLTLLERLPHVVLEDAALKVCGGGEYLHHIVIHHYSGVLSDPLDALDVVAQYQEEPIIDYSIPMIANRIFFMVPSLCL